MNKSDTPTDAPTHYSDAWGDPSAIEPWQLTYFAEALARGLCFAEAGGCGGMIDLTQEQLEALARTPECKARIMLALQKRMGAVGDKEAERMMLRSEAWLGYVACRHRKDERSALSWAKWFAELGGISGSATPTATDLQRMTDAELRLEIERRQDRLRLVGGGGVKAGV